MNNKLLAAAVFSMAVGLFAVAWSIHDHTERHSRYSFSAGARTDTLTGRVEDCSRSRVCQPWIEPEFELE